MRKKIMVVFGTRPEAIKMCPLINELYKHEEFEVIVCVTGQHKDMLDQVLLTFKVVPKYNLKIMKANQSLFDITSEIIVNLKDILIKENPELVLVHGDTSTTFSVALSCYYLGISIGHVEAGLRTNNVKSPFPEEFNRQAVAIISNYDFAPTELAKLNLIKEGKNKDTIYVTGNTGIDALKTTVKIEYEHKYLNWVGKNKLLMITVHRRENLGEPMRNIFKAVNRILNDYSDIKAVYPIHMNPKIRKIADEILGECKNLKIIEPLDVLDFHNFLSRSHIILTDSGGIQEEAPSLGKPVLVVRDETERSEGIESGCLKLIGTNEEKIYNSVKNLLNNDLEYKKMSVASNPYGDGEASKKIVNILLKELCDKKLGEEKV